MIPCVSGMFPKPQEAGAVVSVIALLLGFAQAPFYHVHGEELEHSHGSGLAHMHLRIADEAEEGVHIEARTADDDAVDVVWSIASPAGNAFHFDFDFAGSAALPAPVLAAAKPPVLRLHSHDPPVVAVRHLRGPPA